MGPGNSIMWISMQKFLPPQKAMYTKTKPRKVEFVSTGKNIALYYFPIHEKFHRKTNTLSDGIPKEKENEEEELEGENDNESIEQVSEITENESELTILLSHDKGCDIGNLHPLMKLLHENLRVNICIYDYLGFGLSNKDEEPSEESTYQSIETVINEYLIKTKKTTRQRIILMGFGLGCGTSIEMASRGYKYAGIILHSPYLSYYKSHDYLFERNLVSKVVLGATFNRWNDIFVNESKIGKVKSPVMIIHGKKNQHLSLRNCVELWELVPEHLKFKNILVEKAGRIDLVEMMGETYYKELEEFIEFCRNE